MDRNQPRNYWMVAVPPDHFSATRENGFEVLGLGHNQKKRVQRMEIGDRVLFYLFELRVFTATATIRSTFFEDHSVIWPSNDAQETFAWRVHIQPNVVLHENEYMDARFVAPRLDYVRKWIPERWPLAFQGPLHLIPKKDLLLLEEEMRKIVDNRRRAPKRALK